MLCFAAVQYVKALQEFLASLNYGSLASLMGRYYAMDRDKRYDRIKIAFEALVQGSGEQCLPEALIGLMEQRYAGEGTSRQTDEFMKPIITDKEGCIGGEEIVGHGAVVRRLPPDVSCDEAQLTAVCLAPAPNAADGDTLLFINFRADRVRQITEALGITRHFDTARVPGDLVSGCTGTCPR